jgi:hypothetical protein
MLLRRKKGGLEKSRGMETRFARLDAGSGDFDERSENREGFRFRVFSAGGFSLRLTPSSAAPNAG